MNDSTVKTSAYSTGATPSKDDGQTKPVRDGESAPKLPHERDESADSQQAHAASATRVGEQALSDIESGQVDTDKGPVTERVYEGLKQTR